MRTLAQYPWLLILIAAVIAFLLIRLGFAAIRMLATLPPDEADAALETEDVEAFDLRYRCSVCGTEMRLTRMSTDEDDEDFAAPRHCREEMTLVVEAESPPR